MGIIIIIISLQIDLVAPVAPGDYIQENTLSLYVKKWPDNRCRLQENRLLDLDDVDDGADYFLLHPFIF